MKSQDVLLLLKLVSLEHQERGIPAFLQSKWEDWERAEEPRTDVKVTPASLTGAFMGEAYTTEAYMSQDSLVHQFQALYTVRALAESTGISKSEIGLSLQRSYEIGLAKPARISGVPRVNKRALSEFIMFGIRFVFPVKPGELTRGIATAFAAPAFRNELQSAGETIPVWPDPKGNSVGQAVTPLYKSVPDVVKRDAALYELLAVVDAIRIGQPRERNLASKLLRKLMRTSDHESGIEA